MVFWTKSVRRILWRYVVCYSFIIPRFVLSGNKIEETNRLKDNLNVVNFKEQNAKITRQPICSCQSPLSDSL